MMSKDDVARAMLRDVEQAREWLKGGQRVTKPPELCLAPHGVLLYIERHAKAILAAEIHALEDQEHDAAMARLYGHADDKAAAATAADEIQVDYFVDDGGVAWSAWYPSRPEVGSGSGATRELAIADLEERRRAAAVPEGGAPSSER
jgi:hypothetical protein